MAGMNFSEGLAEFDRFLRAEKNLSPRTRAAYAHDLGQFAAFRWPEVPGDGLLEDVSIADVRSFLAHLREDRGHKPATMARTLSSLRAFFDYALEREWLEVSPCTGLERPRPRRKLPVYLGVEELRRLVEAPDGETTGGKRDRAMLLLMAFAGLRLQETVGLDERHVSLEARAIRVLGKGSKERLVPLNEDAARMLAEWMAVRAPAAGEKALFLNRRGTRISGRMVEKIVEKHARAAGVWRPGLSPHKLRHTFATMLHHNDVDLVEIQALLGHASISTTQIYTHVDRRRLREAVRRLDDLARGTGG